MRGSHQVSAAGSALAPGQAEIKGVKLFSYVRGSVPERVAEWRPHVNVPPSPNRLMDERKLTCRIGQDAQQTFPPRLIVSLPCLPYPKSHRSGKAAVQMKSSFGSEDNPMSFTRSSPNNDG